jgi:hypothetical protein
MSGSIHTTYKALRGLTKSEMYAQYLDPDSDLAVLARKRGIKKRVLAVRKLKPTVNKQ